MEGASSGGSNEMDLSSAESSSPVEAELELGLGLSIGNGGAGKVKQSVWGERGRILTAKDFPAAISHAGASSSSRFSGRVHASGGAVSGTKRTAEFVCRDGGSPPAARTGSSQAVGWPPIRAYRINSLVNQAQNQSAKEERKQLSLNDSSKDVSKSNNTNATNREKGPHGFVKVYMDGLLIGRKVDLNAHSCYETLALMLEDMFFKSARTVRSTGLVGDQNEHTPKLSKLLNGSSEFLLTYEDKEGDWMLVGDVPWVLFLSSVRKLRIMRTSEAKGDSLQDVKGGR